MTKHVARRGAQLVLSCGATGSLRRRLAPLMLLFAGALPGLSCAAPPADDSEAALTRTTATPIMNGTPISTGPASEYPYAAYVSSEVSPGTWTFCSGALIAPDLVLTAAHCVLCKSNASVVFAGAPEAVYAVGQGAIAMAPGALRGEVDCAVVGPDPSETVLDQILVDGADIAVIRLPGAVAGIAPARVMTEPPYGFNPVQWLYGTRAILLGRGLTVYAEHPAWSDLATMRKGEMSVDGWGLDGWGAVPTHPTEPDPFLLHALELASEAAGLPGDSGGPLLAAPFGLLEVIGVTSTYMASGMSTGIAPTFTAANGSFIRGQVAGTSISWLDSDGDDVADPVDNCPLDANTDQMDWDEDGVGDVCDNCSPLQDESSPWEYLWRFPGPTGVQDYSRYRDPDQANCNIEVEDETILTLDPSLGSGTGGVRHLTLSEYRNQVLVEHGESPWLQAMRKWRRGDACDPVPCADIAVQRSSIELPLSPLDPTCVPPGYMTGSCSATEPSAVKLTGLRWRDDGLPPRSGRVGLRYCRCDYDHATEAERRQNCRASSIFGCAVDPNEFNAAGSRWRPMSTGMGMLPSLKFDNAEPGLASVPWDWKSDVEEWTGQPVDTNVTDTPFVKGILWSSVRTFAGVPTGELASNDRVYENLASDYQAEDPTISIERRGGTKIPVSVCYPDCPDPILWPWWTRTCVGPGCDPVGSLPWLWYVDPHHDQQWQVWAVSAAASARVTSRLDDVSIALLTSGAHRVQASEAPALLGRSGAVVREVAVDLAARTVVGSLGVLEDGSIKGLLGGDRLVGDNRIIGGDVAMMSSTAASMAAHGGGAAAPVMAFSALRRSLYALTPALPGGESTLQVWTPAAQWRDLPVGGEAIVHPRAAAYDYRQNGLYVLDQPHLWSPVRLLYVDLALGQVSEVGRVTLAGGIPRVALAMGADGRLVMAVSRRVPALARISRLAVRAADVEQVWWALVPHAMLPEGATIYDTGDGDGVDFVSEEHSAFVIRHASNETFHATHKPEQWCP